MASIPAIVVDKQAHSPSHNTATDPPPGDASYFTQTHLSEPSTGTSTPNGSHTPLAHSDSASPPATPGGTRIVDYNTTAATPDDVDIPGMLFAIPYPTPLNASPNKNRPSFLLYAPPRAAYRRPPPTPDGKKGKEKLVKRIERNWQEEVNQGKAIGKGEISDASRWQKTKGLFTRKASEAIQWLPDSNIEALSRIPPKNKMHQVLVFIPEDPTTQEIQSVTGGHVASRLELEKQLQAARSKAMKRSAISGALLPVTGVIDVLCPVPLFAFEIDAAYFTSQWQGLKKASAMTSNVRLAIQPTPHLGALSQRLLQICHKLSPKQFPSSTTLSTSPLSASAPPLPPRPGATEAAEQAGWEKEERGLRQETEEEKGWYPSEEKRAASPTTEPVQLASAHAPSLPPRPSAAPPAYAEDVDRPVEKNHPPVAWPTDADYANEMDYVTPPPGDKAATPTDNDAPPLAAASTSLSSAPPPLPPRPSPAPPSLAPTSITDPFTDAHHSACDRASSKADPFGSSDPSDACSVAYTATNCSSAPNTAPNTPATAWSAAPQGAVTRAHSPTLGTIHSGSATPSVEGSAPSTDEANRRPVPKAPPLPTAARALAEAVVRQVRAAVPGPVAERHALDDIGALAADIERCLEKGAKEYVKTL